MFQTMIWLNVDYLKYRLCFVIEISLKGHKKNKFHFEVSFQIAS